MSICTAFDIGTEYINYKCGCINLFFLVGVPDVLNVSEEYMLLGIEILFFFCERESSWNTKNTLEMYVMFRVCFHQDWLWKVV